MKILRCGNSHEKTKLQKSQYPTANQKRRFLWELPRFTKKLRTVFCSGFRQDPKSSELKQTVRIFINVRITNSKRKSYEK
ncbi:hypothetical protein LIL_10593 [Leptospira interrogans serovar Linhai str. 56609]|uniref:Uncharacterized protein n=1 Tax=Leptospira interrogans serogroup Icterohaemorrhagiae serovar copenhageni (strain Fiocruz L1-130) TaxID=267671 RepID=Q72US2_LEPIC|nr:conserved hypothetical protein [Leptospira interrogans serovar Copenhageni str. Fiocruz L1-130]AJR13195.1 hypothetical protein LIL_10593 [Leptospira interrogans serovar Linhai str. 56609]